MSGLDFKDMTSKHIQRVGSYMVYLYEMNKEAFSSLNVTLIASYAQLHDRPKLMTVKELKSYGYRGRTDIADVFSQFYGRRFAALNFNDRELSKFTHIELLRIEKILKDKFLKNYYIDQVNELKLIEEIADITDVGIHRREEFAISQGVEYDGAEYLGLKKYPKEVIEMSKRLEDHINGKPCMGLLK